MSEDKIITESEYNREDLLSVVAQQDSELKEHLVKYVGEKFDKEEVTVHMIAEIMAHEFPEFMVSIAEENFLRGYKLGLDDGTELINRNNEGSNTKE
tara:strand:- start:1892 stop:2182 length:291 start_codon:yes stop_codon:yes gene_type:complete